MAGSRGVALAAGLMVSIAALAVVLMRRWRRCAQSNTDGPVLRSGEHGKLEDGIVVGRQLQDNDDDESDEGLTSGRTPKEARALLTRIYRKHNPEKLADLDRILNKYAGDYESLFAQLRVKYGCKIPAAGTDRTNKSGRAKKGAQGASAAKGRAATGNVTPAAPIATKVAPAKVSRKGYQKTVASDDDDDDDDNGDSRAGAPERPARSEADPRGPYKQQTVEVETAIAHQHRQVEMSETAPSATNGRVSLDMD